MKTNKQKGGLNTLLENAVLKERPPKKKEVFTFLIDSAVAKKNEEIAYWARVSKSYRMESALKKLVDKYEQRKDFLDFFKKWQEKTLKTV